MSEGDTKSPEAVEKARDKLENSVLRIDVGDGRCVQGYFEALDKDGSILLKSCSEVLREREAGELGKSAGDLGTSLGTVFVPSVHIRRIMAKKIAPKPEDTV